MQLHTQMSWTIHVLRACELAPPGGSMVEHQVLNVCVVSTNLCLEQWCKVFE